MEQSEKLLEEIKSVIIKCIELNNIKEAKEIIVKIPMLGTSTGITCDAELYYLSAIVAETEGLYGLSLYFLEKGLKLEPDNQQLLQYYEVLSGNSNVALIDTDLTYEKKRMRIIAITGVFAPLDLFMNEFVSVFELLGHDVFVLDYGKKGVYLETIDFIRKGVDLVVSFNNSFEGIKDLNGHSIINRLGCRKVNIFVDHPLFTIENIYELLDERFLLYVTDKEHKEYLDNYKELKSANIFLPHGGKALNNVIRPLMERSIDVLYVGSSKDYKGTNYELATECVNAMIANPNLDSKECVLKVYKENGEEAKALTQETLDTLRRYELHALGYYRVNAVRLLVENGIKVHVYGLGWENVPFANNPNFIYGGCLSPEECLEKMYDSKIVLNSMPWFKDGTHERIFNAMLAGAVSVTDKSRWLTENLEDKKNIVFYDLEKMDVLKDKITDILANLEKYQAVADEGYKCAVAKHTWSHRALQVLKDVMSEIQNHYKTV